MTPEHHHECAERISALESENARLRSLLDEIHRGDSTAPRAPKKYDAVGQSCQIPVFVRVAGHMNCHCTNEAIAKRVDAAAQEREDA